MSQSRVTYRYAKALLLFSVEKNMLQSIYSDMCFVERVCVENKELTLLLKSPIIKTDKKQKILHEVFGSKITEVSMKFVQIITNKKREHLLEDIARAFLVQYKQHNNIEEVVVTTATPLTNELKESIKEIRGPRLGAPENAIDGFLKKNGIKKGDLQERKTDKGDFYFYSFKVNAQSLPNILSRIFTFSIEF